MTFLAIVLCGLVLRMFRGCLKGLLLIVLIALVLRHDHELARQFWDVVDTLMRKGTEFINEP
jgi:hypothetical protein